MKSFLQEQEQSMETDMNILIHTPTSKHHCGLDVRNMTMFLHLCQQISYAKQDVLYAQMKVEKKN